MPSCIASQKPALSADAKTTCAYDADNNCVANPNATVTRTAQCYQVMPGAKADAKTGSYDLTDTKQFRAVDASKCSGALDIYSYSDNAASAVKADKQGVPCTSIACSAAYDACAVPVYAYGVGAFTGSGSEKPSNTCVCPNGTAASSGSCPQNGATQCVSCEDGYTLVGSVCKKSSDPDPQGTCQNCAPQSKGPCQAAGTNVCYAFNPDGTCPPNTSAC